MILLDMLFESLGHSLRSTSRLHLALGPIPTPEVTLAVFVRTDLECQQLNYTVSERARTASVASLKMLVAPGKNLQIHCDLNGT